MARRNAIIRRLPAVETLGSVSVICSDKTGTLTRNEMTVREVVTADGLYEVTGVGYHPEGEFIRAGNRVDPASQPPLMALVRAGLLCNDAELRSDGGTWHVAGDPMEAALVCLAAKTGLDARALRGELPRQDEFPFDAVHRFMATLHDQHADASLVLIKGAPERILQMCDSVRGPSGTQPIDREAWWFAAERLATQGRRVLAFASKTMPAARKALSIDHVTREATLLGLAGFIDPPRDEAIAAVAECRAAGIRVLMITGDHAVTAQAIARDLGLATEPGVLSGHDIESLDSAALRQAVHDTDVFARTTPEHKLRLVGALQDEGLTVAMTGDGVNDAPALKRADVGVAMGGKGTEAAKEAAAMVLADDNFASIAHAVEEGRTVYDNLRKAITFLLPVNGGESLSLVAAILFGLTLPITPVQILWVNMVSSVGLAMALAFEPTEADVMQRPPRPPREPVLSAFLVWRVALVSVLFLAGIFGMFELALARGATVEEARTVAVNTLVAMEVFYLFSVRYLRTPSFTFEGVKGTRPVLIAVGIVFALQLLFTYAPFMTTFFHSHPLSVPVGLQIVGVGVALLVVLEAEKLVRRAWLARR
jgi:magnesium-transporting ATPase (P-type)